MTKQDLLDALEKTAAEWTSQAGLSNDHSEGERYGKIQQELKSSYGINAYIEAIEGDSSRYVVKFA